MATTNTTYETAFIVNAGLEDTAIDAVIEKVKDLILKSGGEITDLVKWGRKRFSYPIKRKNNGFYMVMEFKAPGDVVAKLERHFHLEENIFRFLTIAFDVRTLKIRSKPSDLLKIGGTDAPPVPGTATPAQTPAAPVAAAPPVVAAVAATVAAPAPAPVIPPPAVPVVPPPAAPVSAVPPAKADAPAAAATEDDDDDEA